jgi:hypothetical protein
MTHSEDGHIRDLNQSKHLNSASLVAQTSTVSWVNRLLGEFNFGSKFRNTIFECPREKGMTCFSTTMAQHARTVFRAMRASTRSEKLTMNFKIGLWLDGLGTAPAENFLSRRSLTSLFWDMGHFCGCGAATIYGSNIWAAIAAKPIVAPVGAL